MKIIKIIIFFILLGVAISAISIFLKTPSNIYVTSGFHTDYGWPIPYEIVYFICDECPSNVIFDYFKFSYNVLFWSITTFLLFLTLSKIGKKDINSIFNIKRLYLLAALLLSSLTIITNVYIFDEYMIPVPYLIKEYVNQPCLATTMISFVSCGYYQINYFNFSVDVIIYFFIWLMIINTTGSLMEKIRKTKAK